MARAVLISLVALLLAGCATAGHQTREILAISPESLPRAAEVRSVPFVRQTEKDCGPASLAMVMQWAGQKVTLEQITPEVMTPGGKGSLQTDLITASRRHGLLAIPIYGMESLVREVAAGHPVIVFQNLFLSVFPKWHYAVATAYDLQSQQLTLNSGKEEREREYLNRFERTWKLADYWGLVVLPADQLSATAGELDHLKAAVGLEQASRLDEADRAYTAIVGRWTKSLPALIGLGNVAFQKKNYVRSVKYLKQAMQWHPESVEAQNNLQVAEEALRSSR